MKFTLFLAAALLPLASIAQQGRAIEFPATSIAPSAQELSAYLSGKSFRGKYADGTPISSKYGSDGSLSASAPNFYDTGKWKTEDGRLCGSLRKIGEFCNDARLDSGALYLRRINGEIVRYDPE
jgi:hypothetical protein